MPPHPHLLSRAGLRAGVLAGMVESVVGPAGLVANALIPRFLTACHRIQRRLIQVSQSHFLDSKFLGFFHSSLLGFTSVLLRAGVDDPGIATYSKARS